MDSPPYEVAIAEPVIFLNKVCLIPCNFLIADYTYFIMILALIFQLLLPSTRANDFTLHFIPSPKGVNWSKPQSLAFSVLKNQIAHVSGGDRHEIGHVYEELRCGDQHHYLGVTSVGNSEERELMFKQGYGLGILFHTFRGQFDDEAEEAADIAALQAVGRSNFVRFLISDAACARMSEYLKEYQFNHYEESYEGLNARPLNGNGSGCSAFATSFLEVSGLQIPEFEDQWMSHYVVPWKFIGGPLTGRKVSILKLIFAFSAHWETDPAKGYPTQFWDPEKMFWWTKQLYADIETGTTRTFPWDMKTTISGQSQGVEFDARNVVTPTGPIFHPASP
jgi:hypothetical protein